MVTGELPPFAGVAELEAWSGTAASSPAAEATLSAASEYVRRFCGWHIFPSLELDLLLDSPGGAEVQLPSRYVTAVEALTFAGTLWPATSYEWSALGQVRALAKPPNCTPSHAEWWEASPGFPAGYRALRAQFTSGYETVPGSIAAVVLGVVARALASPAGVVREQAGLVSLSYSSTSSGASGGLAFLGPELAVLEGFRIVGA